MDLEKVIKWITALIFPAIALLADFLYREYIVPRYQQYSFTVHLVVRLILLFALGGIFYVIAKNFFYADYVAYVVLYTIFGLTIAYIGRALIRKRH